MNTKPEQCVANIDLVYDGMQALEAIEQLLGVAVFNQMNEVHADKMAMLLYVVRDRMRTGIEGVEMCGTLGPRVASDSPLSEKGRAFNDKFADDVVSANRKRHAAGTP